MLTKLKKWFVEKGWYINIAKEFNYDTDGQGPSSSHDLPIASKTVLFGHLTAEATPSAHL